MGEACILKTMTATAKTPFEAKIKFTSAAKILATPIFDIFCFILL